LNTFLKRTLTGIIFAIVLVSSIIFSQYSFAILMLIIILLAVNEFHSLIYKEHKITFLGSLSAILFFLSHYFYASQIVSFEVLLVNLLIFIAIPIIELYRSHEKPFEHIAVLFTEIIYLALPFSLLNFIVFDSNAHYSPIVLLAFIFMIWANDTGAYLVGSQIGRTPLFKKHSPKKTIEGSLGGLILVLVVAYLFFRFWETYSLAEWLILGVLVTVFGTLGDLVESMLKRSLQVKDSGNLLPGHGGVLDRFDSIILASPVVFIYLKMIEFL
jgi:phosphatidate cytidylyltransferase